LYNTWVELYTLIISDYHYSWVNTRQIVINFLYKPAKSLLLKACIALWTFQTLSYIALIKSRYGMLKEQSFHIISDYNNVAEVNDRIKTFLNFEGGEQHMGNAVEICMTEALNNVIKHAYNGDETKDVNINIRKDKNFFEIEIIDQGEPRTSLVVNELDFDPQDINNLPESGMGLFIIQQLMDEMKYFTEDGKNHFILKKWLI
jgi:serine/threonine-protein kinase RsbW